MSSHADNGLAAGVGQTQQPLSQPRFERWPRLAEVSAGRPGERLFADKAPLSFDRRSTQSLFGVKLP